MAAEDAKPECLGDSLPEKWWRDREAIQHEYRAHGRLADAARAHGVKTGTVSKAWSEMGLPRLPNGVRAAAETREVVAPGDPVSEVEILRARNRELERQVREVRTGEVESERVVQRLEDAIATLTPHYKRPTKPRGGKGTEQELVLLFSDTHAAEVVRPEEVLGMNAYDWPVMLERMAAMQESVLSHREHFAAPIRKLHVFLLGDMLSGDIHEELVATNDRPTAEAAVQFAYDAAEWLQGFTAAGLDVTVHGVPGNHPRPRKKPSAKQAHNNADWIAYKLMEALLARNPQVECHFPKAAYATPIVCDRWRWLIMHGDGIRSTMPGVPWGGVVRRITTLEQQFSKAGQPLDYVALGHFHSANALDGVGVETFMNGSVKGLDEYSLKTFGSGRGAKQRLIAVHPKRGVTAAFWIDLQEQGEVAA